ncbi:Conidial development protein fluffy [Colletotrichum chlorophyti]|uniref:Conidial development protein fluffy n=1 Tax=Colletotrichum chlorophyti TaxID=708187 RepID=A0A1Q8RXA8_9PEZI|nr:Conidial development protein fluffy [Colletotrichum chlorophyti]
MTSRVPLTPVPKNNTRRKLRVCTREACEVCREKKAKCNGEKPCSRCVSRGEKCHYKSRSYQTKSSLQAQLAELKDAQRQRDAVLEALSAPGQNQDLLLRLWNGEPLESIYETLESRDSSSSPASTQVVASPEQSPHDFKENSNPIVHAYLASPPILDYSNPAMIDRPDTGYLSGAIEEQSFVQPSTKPQPAEFAPTFNTAIFEDESSTNGLNQFELADYSPNAPYCSLYGNQGMVDQAQMTQNPVMDFSRGYFSDAYSTNDLGAVNWWAENIPNSSFPSFSSESSAGSMPWNGHPLTTPVFSNSPSTYSVPSVPSSTPTPMTTDSSLPSRPSSREMLRPTDAPTMEEAQHSVRSPPKKRKSTAGQIPVITAPVVNAAGAPKVSGQNSSPRRAQKTPPPRRRERHRQASARNWQKQKQQTADLQAAKNEAEARHRELKREYTEVLSQVMAAKNALMDHASCNHPAISSWLRCQATNYVMRDGGMGGDRQSSIASSPGYVGAPGMVAAAPAHPRTAAGCDGALCR